MQDEGEITGRDLELTDEQTRVVAAMIQRYKVGAGDDAPHLNMRRMPDGSIELRMSHGGMKDLSMSGPKVTGFGAEIGGKKGPSETWKSEPDRTDPSYKIGTVKGELAKAEGAFHEHKEVAVRISPDGGAIIGSGSAHFGKVEGKLGGDVNLGRGQINAEAGVSAEAAGGKGCVEGITPPTKQDGNVDALSGEVCVAGGAGVGAKGELHAGPDGIGGSAGLFAGLGGKGSVNFKGEDYPSLDDANKIIHERASEGSLALQGEWPPGALEAVRESRIPEDWRRTPQEDDHDGAAKPRVWFDPDDMDGYINVSRDGHTLERMSLEDAKRQGLVPPDADFGDLRQYRWADHRESYMSSVAGDADSIREVVAQMEETVENLKQQVDELQPLADAINQSAATVDGQLADAQTASEAAKQLHADIVTAKDAAAEDAREAAEAAATAQQMAEQAAKSDEIQAEAKQAEAASETAKKEAKAAEQAAARAEDEASEARQAGDRADARAKEADLAASTAQHAAKEATKAAAQARTEAKEAQAAVAQVDASVKAALGHLAGVTRIKAQIAKLLETASDLQEQVEAKQGEGARLKGDIDDLMSKGRSEAQTRLREADDASRKSDTERTTAEHVRDGAQNAARDADNHENKAEQSHRACTSHLQDTRGAATRAQASLQDVIRCVEKARSMRG